MIIPSEYHKEGEMLLNTFMKCHCEEMRKWDRLRPR